MTTPSMFMLEIFLCLVGAHILAACGNEQTAITQAQQQQIDQIARFSDSLQPQASWNFDFEKLPAGQTPIGWTPYFTGEGNTDWKISRDNENQVLAQLYSDNPGSHFNIIVNDSIQAKDLKLSVKLKGVGGKHDQGGGLVWRFIDKNNHYIVRANPLEANVVLYKMEKGKRIDLPLVGLGKTYGMQTEPLGKGWNMLSLTVKGEWFTVFLNGKELFKVQDRTFASSGKVGFWTKADAVTYFDDFEVEKYE